MREKLENTLIIGYPYKSCIARSMILSNKIGKGPVIR